MATSRILHFSVASSSRLLKQRIVSAHQPCRLLASNSDDSRAKSTGFSAVSGSRNVQSPFRNSGRVTSNSFLVKKPSDSGPPKQQAQPDVMKMKYESAETDKKAPSTDAGSATPAFNGVASASAEKNGIMRQLNERFGLHIDENLSDDEKRRQKMARNTKVGSFIVFGGLLAGFVWFCFHYGKAQRDESGAVVDDEFSGSIFAPFRRILHGFTEWRDYVVEPSRELLLPDPLPFPYHQPKYTVVLEMKNVLVNPEWTYKDGHRFKMRPALEYFLDIVGYPNFEVVVYTSETSMTFEPVVHSIDPKQRIMYKLYRDCTKYVDGHHVKDLNRLNRDLSKVIYIDFDPKSFQLNPENVLRIPKWEGDMTDTTLVDLAELLKTIHMSDVEDVRPMLQYYSQFDDPAKEFRNRAIYLAEQEAKRKEQGPSGTMSKYSSWIPGRRHRV